MAKSRRLYRVSTRLVGILRESTNYVLDKKLKALKRDLKEWN